MPNNSQITEEQAREEARKAVALLRSPFELLGVRYEPEKILELLRKAWLDPQTLGNELVAATLSPEITREQFDEGRAGLVPNSEHFRIPEAANGQHPLHGRFSSNSCKFFKL